MMASRLTVNISLRILPLALAMQLLVPVSSPAQDVPQKKNSQYGGERLETTIEGTRCFLIKPSQQVAAASQPWIWYAPTFLGEGPYPNERHTWLFTRLVKKGFWIAGCDIGESFGNRQGRTAYTKFYDFAVKHYKLSPKPCLLVQSRGGLMHLNWAAEHPRSVRCFAAIYPVCNLTSWPTPPLERASKAYGMTVEEMQRHLPENNPIDRLAPLAEAGVPIFLIHGDADTLVPLEQNSAELGRRYRALGGKVELVVVKGEGHKEVDAFFESTQLLNFLLQFR